jgi:hypothetical protein
MTIATDYMPTRKLLELAARAGGVQHIVYTNDYDGKHGLVLCDDVGRHVGEWNPLHNDGDAFRLEVTMKDRMKVYWCNIWKKWNAETDSRFFADDDRKRCSVLGAASIGAEMLDKQ